MVQGRLLTSHPGGVHVVEKLPVVILPSGRVPGRVLLVLPIWEARRRRNRDEITKKGSVLEGFGTRCKYMPKGGISGDLGGPGAPPGAARRGAAPPGRLEPWWPPSGPTSVVWKLPER